MGIGKEPRKAKRLRPSPLEPTKNNFRSMISWGLIVLVAVVVFSVSTFFIFAERSTGGTIAPTGVAQVMIPSTVPTLGPPSRSVTGTPTLVVSGTKVTSAVDPTVTVVQPEPSPTLTATVPPPTATATQAPQKTYTVRQGDTVFGIADQLGISADDLLKLNNLSDPNALKLDQVLIIP